MGIPASQSWSRNTDPVRWYLVVDSWCSYCLEVTWQLPTRAISCVARPWVPPSLRNPAHLVSTWFVRGVAKPKPRVPEIGRRWPPRAPPNLNGHPDLPGKREDPPGHVSLTQTQCHCLNLPLSVTLNFPRWAEDLCFAPAALHGH